MRRRRRRQGARRGTAEWNATLETTRTRVAAGDRVVLWAETALEVDSDEEVRLG